MYSLAVLGFTSIMSTMASVSSPYVRESAFLEDACCDVPEVCGLLLFLVLLGFQAHIDKHVLLLVPSERHHRYVKRTAVPHLDALDHRKGRINVSFSMDRMPAALRCSSEPICPLSFMPFGTKCSTQTMQQW
jgi:hypothetical protein